MDWDSQVYLSKDKITYTQISLRDLEQQLNTGIIAHDTFLFRDNSEGWLSLKAGLIAIRNEFPAFPDYPNIEPAPRRLPPPIPPIPNPQPTKLSVSIPENERPEEAPRTESTQRTGGCLSSLGSLVSYVFSIGAFLFAAALIVGFGAMFSAETNPTRNEHIEAIVFEVVPNDMPILPYVTEQWALIYAGMLGPHFTYEDFGVASTGEIRTPNGELLISTSGSLGNVSVTIHGEGSVAQRLVGGPPR